MSHWNRYQPTPAAPWDWKRVIHLHRRAAFGACWSEVQRDLSEDPQVAVTRVLDGTCRSEGVPTDFDQLATIIGDSAVDSANPARLAAWWVYRCLFSTNPLEERLTLMWHNHFATSNLKVNDLKLMKVQNETLRRLSRASFGDLLRGMARDPALLDWLDAPSNRVGKPNENLARELLELFSLGVGHYSERDVAESARALTGCTVRLGQFHMNDENHDGDTKTILNQTGNWTSDDLVRILLEQSPCADRIAWRLTNEFFGEHVVSDAARDELAAGLRERQLDIRWAVETMLRSELFFSSANLGSRIADPVTFVVLPLRALECWRSPPSTLVLADWLERMGQVLFYPPNVGGWNGGRQWLTTRTVIARANYATALAKGQLTNSLHEPVSNLGKLLCSDPDAIANATIEKEPHAERTPSERFSQDVRELLYRPEAQLN